MDYSKSFIQLVWLIFAFTLVISCNKYKAIELEFSEKNYYPVIRINDPNVSDLLIHPVSESEGSIGVRINNNVYWVQGIPQKKDNNTYEWKLNKDYSVLMKLDNTVDECKILLSLNANKVKADEWYISFKTEPDEYFTGIFERVVDGAQSESWKKGIKTAMNLRGEKVEMKLKPTVSAYSPFYISSANYGFKAEGTWPGVFDFGKTKKDIVKISFEGPQFDFKIYFGEPMEIVQKHTLETGPPVILPDWAYGPWRWRDDHTNSEMYYDSTGVKSPFNSEISEDILMMKALEIPLTAYWIDRPWATGPVGFDDYETDSLRLPEFQKMIEWFNSQDIALMMWIAPFVMGDMYDYAMGNNYCLKSHDFDIYPQALMDFTNPEACKWWGENGPAKLARMGIKGFKLDRADGEKLLDSLELLTHSGISYRENYNDFPRQYVKTTYDAIKPILEDDFVLFPRSQYTGSSKYGAMWAGDTDGSPEGLRSAIIGMQRCAVMGYPLWGSDIGGYWGDYSKETCKRWLAFGCFSPIMEVGPTNNKGFWNEKNEPYYDKELLAIWRLYSQVRMKLKPYITELAKEAATKGTPVSRPLFLEFPEQEESWKNWQTYMLGPDILVSAIWEKGNISQNVYLPSGTKWINAWEPEKVYQGGQYVEVKTPDYLIPVFIRKGSSVNLGDLNALYKESLQKVTEAPDMEELERKEGWR